MYSKVQKLPNLTTEINELNEYFVLLFEHSFPCQPSVQLQVYEPALFMQVPPLKHGEFRHSLTSGFKI